MNKYTYGSIEKDFGDQLEKHKGWLVGNFIGDEHELRKSEDLEIKWHKSKKGDFREKWSLNKKAKTLCFVITGKVTFIVPDKEVILKPGDYFLSSGGIPHKTKYLEDSLTITIRWPSLPSDHEDLDEI